MVRKKRGLKQEPSSKDAPWWEQLWRWTAFGEKSGWDWLQLLLVPLALAAIGFWFSQQQQDQFTKRDGDER